MPCRSKSGAAIAWLDTGTPESLLQAAQYVELLEQRQGLRVGVPEEIAFRAGWISAEQVERMAQPMLKNGYGQYLLRILKERVF